MLFFFIALLLLNCNHYVRAEKLATSRVQVVKSSSSLRPNYSGSNPAKNDAGASSGVSQPGAGTKIGSLPIASMLTEARDELIDIVEGFVFAKDNGERIDHMIDVIDRNKVTLSVVGGVWLIRNRLLSKAVAQKVGKASITSMRDAEAAKWGTRRKAF